MNKLNFEKMEKLVLSFMTLDGISCIEIQPITDESFSIYCKILKLFLDDIPQSEASRIAEKHYALLQLTSLKLKIAVAESIRPLAANNPPLNKLIKKIDRLPDGEFFLVLPYDPQDFRHRRKLEIMLQTLNNASNHDNIEQDISIVEEKIMSFFGIVMENYESFEPRSDIRTVISDTSDASHICRFCHRTGQGDGATFRKAAHAIPEALGNKNVILRDECDECNGYFGDNIEPDLISYLDIYRVFYKVKGKNGIPELQFKNGFVRHFEGKMLVVVNKSSDRGSSSDNNESSSQQGAAFSIPLQSSKNLTPANVYKALCKIALSVIDKSELKYLLDCINWVRYDIKPTDQIPPIAINVMQYKNFETPSIRVLVRSTDDSQTPHVVCEFHFGALVFIYILPFSKKDSTSFSGQAFTDLFWNKFDHFKTLPNWNFMDFSDSVAREVKFVITVTDRDPSE